MYDMKNIFKDRRGASSLFYNMLLFGVCLQLGAYLVWSFNVVPGIVYPLGQASDITDLNNLFSINAFSALVGLTGVGIGIAAILLRANTYAVFAVLLFAIGVFFRVVQTFVLAIPNAVAAIIPASWGGGPIQVVVGAIVVFAGFMYLFELAIQRKAS